MAGGSRPVRAVDSDLLDQVSALVPAAPRWTERLDLPLFAFAGLSAAWLAFLLVREGSRPGWQSALLPVFWVLFTYLVLPRLHRILTSIYVPDYFFGRARTSDGLLGDPVNLALLGHEAQVHEVLGRAGWIRADDLDLHSARRIVTSTLGRRSYPQAPVSPLHLFGRQQDFAYQQEVAGSPSKRHHVRFWRCPQGWLLPGGFAVDWLAAGTYDRSVGLSLFTLQVTHKIAEDTDVERDHILETVTTSSSAVRVHVLENFSSGYHARNGGGDRIRTDGDLPVLDTAAVPVSPLPPPALADSRNKRPASTTFAGVASLVRALTYGVTVVLVLSGRANITLTPTLSSTTADILVATGLGLVGVVDLLLGVGVLRGRNWARLLLMASCVVTVVVAFVNNLHGTEALGLGSGLPALTLSILVLLALTSERARDHALHDPGAAPDAWATTLAPPRGPRRRWPGEDR